MPTITNKQSSTITENTYHLTKDDGGKIIYTEFLNDKGKLTDCILRTESGIDIDDANLLEEVQELIDKV